MTHESGEVTEEEWRTLTWDHDCTDRCKCVGTTCSCGWDGYIEQRTRQVKYIRTARYEDRRCVHCGEVELNREVGCSAWEEA